MKRIDINWNVVRAILRRDLRLYFSNPTGYVFITLFIFLSAAAAFWQDRFFLNNLANLTQLNTVFPYLLLFFVPAITMGVWSEERKQGTEELLLTLPATDLEVVLGKYLSTVGVFTAAVAASLSHLIVLFWLGRPDIGLMLGNYFGYWLAGAALISVGMLASRLSANVTIAFILGAAFCAIFVYAERILAVFGSAAGDLGARLAVWEHFGDFARGVVSLSGILYFIGIAAVMLYLNVVLVGRRHWPPTADGHRMSFHYAIRTVALAVAFISVHAMLTRAGARLDVTAERLHSLSGESKDLIREIPEDRPVFVQAFVSKDVPRPYVQTRENLLGFLREYDAVGGNRVHVVIHETELYSDQARDAREKFGIHPVDVPEVEGSRANVRKVFMGVAFTCGAAEDVITFFDRGLPTEYEIARSIRVVARAERRKIGVVNTQVRLFGGLDFNTFQTSPSWPVVAELQKQYEVVQINPQEPIVEPVDALVVALPSSLSEEEMSNLQGCIARGTPALLIDDPVPVFDVGLSPSEESGANVNPFMRNRGPQPKPKGGINMFLDRFGILWNKQQIVWDRYNPHPELASLPPEVIFIGPGNGSPESFNPSFPATMGMQELVFLFAGSVMPTANSPFAMEPLVKTSVASGTTDYGQVIQKTFFGMGLVPYQGPRYATSTDYVVAAHVSGQSVESGDTTRANVIFIADLDFISDQFFEIRRRGYENLDFDNVSFFLNCIDVLAGDESFIELRRRRVQHRTLTTVEARTRAYAEQRAQEEQQAQMDAQTAMMDAQQRLDQRIAEVQQRADLDATAKQIMARNLQEAETRRFESIKATIEAERDLRIEGSKEDMESQVRRIQSGIKTLAGLLPPIPVFVLGIMIFVRRRRRENEGAAASRRLRG
ncbi:MAG TPA: Gldg family protein [Candidatus Krumholzibacteria bacterium]|nr:Gldg family protein [Candidatus Krumholzibacteria bacterium]